MIRKPMRMNSRESSSLLNPAFMALLCHRAVEAYELEALEPMPFFLPFLCVPASLHPDVRRKMTYNKSSNLMSWVEDNSDMRLAIQQAAVGLAPYMSEALSFALAYRLLKVSDGGLLVGSRGPTKLIKFDTAEVQECQKAARYLGRWFAGSGTTSHISAILGVSP